MTQTRHTHTLATVAQRLALCLSMCGLLLLSGCASVPGPANPKDPFQSTNRAIFQFNQTVDNVVLKPAAKGYRFVTPEFVRDGIHNFFSNLREITVVVNDLLQGKLSQGGQDTLRFTINSTVGLLGFIDVASHAGLEKHQEDFGQTLGRWGVASGPYLVLPLMGPSSVRDTIGLMGDIETSPYTVFQHVSALHRNEALAVDTIQVREGLLNNEDLINEAALSADHYNFVRDAWLQYRNNQVYDGHPPPDPDDQLDDTPASSSLPSKK